MSQLLEEKLKEALKSNNKLDLKSELLHKISSGQILMTPQANYYWLNRLFFVLLIVMSILNVASIYYFVNELGSSETYTYWQLFTSSLSDYRGLAWSAFSDSIPWYALGLFGAAVIGLVASLVLRHRYKKLNILK